ncbi:MAG: phosphoribosylamine--glycine ligase [Bacillota bacterium]|nr:phosphoribosylamine--glycine ligase [Bacillota bacterium]HHU62104.1 phosphoribosylamine--glycine ligase [Natronincola sp.]
MKVLVIGRGGREHSLCEKIKSSHLVSKVFVAPGNPGMANVAEQVAINEGDHEQLVSFAHGQKISLVFIGPEQPLVEGLTDRFSEAGIKVFAPSQKAAEIEGSKTYAKELMIKYGIPTADYKVFREFAEAKAYLDQCQIPIVIKADGLAAGKGVVVAETRAEAEEALREMLLDEKFGSASSKVIIEEFLDGEEFSFMALVHGDLVIPLDVAQDHKRAFDGDAGPNTGGMGSYSPVPQISKDVLDTAIETILRPTAEALLKEGRSFTGILYAGLILTSGGPKVIEFNARFGDPETQVLLPRLKSDLVDVVVRLMQGGPVELSWSNQAMLGVVVAREGYPEESREGVQLDLPNDLGDLHLYYSGVISDAEGNFTSSGGRIFLLAALGDDLEEAQNKVYDCLNTLKLPGLFHRNDIGFRAIK